MAENFFGNTDTGRMRDNNEDAFFAEKVWNGEMIAACVIDGVGGYEGGEIAAAIAKDTILEHIKDRSENVFVTMKEALAVANQRIYAERSKNRERQSMACVLTLALADVKNNQFFYIHIGDTRLYLFRDSSLVKVTKDHSFVGFLEDSKRLSEAEAMNHPKRNEINKALGFDPNMGGQDDYAETGQSPFLPGDLLLLCSDGLTDLVNSNNITAILTSKNSLEHKTRALIDAANQAGGKDNITVVLVQNDKKPLEHQATKPITLKKKESQKVEEPVQENKAEPPLVIQSVKKGGSTAIILLSILCLALMGALAWLWMNPRAKKEAAPQAAAQSKRNASEQKLLDSMNAAGSTLILSDSTHGNRIVISDTLYVQKDSLHIVGNGQTLVRDSAFRGPAFALSPTTRYVLLENFTLQDFDIGILAQPRALFLVNVKFMNCRVPIMSQYALPAGVGINAQLFDSIRYNFDSTQKR